MVVGTFRRGLCSTARLRKAYMLFVFCLAIFKTDGAATKVAIERDHTPLQKCTRKPPTRLLSTKSSHVRAAVSEKACRDSDRPIKFSDDYVADALEEKANTAMHASTGRTVITRSMNRSSLGSLNAVCVAPVWVYSLTNL